MGRTSTVQRLHIDMSKYDHLGTRPQSSYRRMLVRSVEVATKRNWLCTLALAWSKKIQHEGWVSWRSYVPVSYALTKLTMDCTSSMIVTNHSSLGLATLRPTARQNTLYRPVGVSRLTAAQPRANCQSTRTLCSQKGTPTASFGLDKLSASIPAR